MKKWIVCLLLFAAVSCRRAIERAQREIRIERIESVERQGSRGAKVALRVTNGTNHDLVFRHIDFQLCYGGDRVADIVLRERVKVPRRMGDSVVSLWKIDYSMAASAVLQKLRRHETERMSVRYAVRGHAGLAPVRIDEEMGLSDFLTTFGLSLDEILTYLDDE